MSIHYNDKLVLELIEQLPQPQLEQVVVVAKVLNIKEVPLFWNLFDYIIKSWKDKRYR